ncbi:Lytic transglycosylase catalytic [Desulfonatronospira thiodismutans ASO3-1]|uniref:Lytic transglycosylase catalytic n=1 Tax=Desulfonatronospira thiodismutans ASO3-1 TaxID=555779 RepID=D6SP66_9BACT|nr:transglycosylase SLT domain-containing protein [Desulfonatronospira thiodismutans]EFI34542.1 Lytic transglycosylase catalytic [Desulfonatronospira thiodismutans ASO3-1]
MSYRLNYCISSKEIAAIICLLLVQGVLVFWYEYSYRMELRQWTEDTIRIGFKPSQRVDANLSPYGPGLDRELVELFCSRNGLTPVWVELQDFRQGMEKLINHDLQLLLPVPGMQTPDKKSLQRGPVYLEGRFLVLHNQWRYPLRSLEDLCATDVVVPGRSAFDKILQDVREVLQCELEPSKRPEPGKDFFDALAERRFRFGIKDEKNYTFWKGFYPEVRRTEELDETYSLNWLWSSHYMNLDRNLERFWEDIKNSGLLDELLERYLGFYPKEQDPYELRQFQHALQNEMPKYAQTIRDVSRRYSLDPLLLVAIIYQESRFDPGATSRTGVRGLMQITSHTAEFLGIEDHLDPHQSIAGGARYLQMLGERMDRIGIESWDKWFMALAAYNQGLGHVYDARTLAERQGYNPDSWNGLKKTYPLLSYKEYYETVPRGYTRGYEAVNFVESVRYYYSLLYGHALLSRFEAEHLGGFLDLVPSDWPQ